MSKRIKIELGALLFILIIGAIWFSQDFFKEKISHYYYTQAIAAIRAGNEQAATENVLKGIAWDPLPGGADYLEFQRVRSELKQQKL